MGEPGSNAIERGVSRTEQKLREEYIAFEFGDDTLRRALSASDQKLWPVDRMKETVQRLKDHQFASVYELVRKHPAVLGVSPKKVDEICTALTTIGIKKYQAPLTEQPVIFSQSPQSIIDIAYVLTQYGFKDIVEFIEKTPAVLTRGAANIARVASIFTGFRFPIDSFVVIATEAPSVLFEHRKNLQTRLEYLSRLPLSRLPKKDFRAVVVKAPTILRYSVEVYEKSMQQLARNGVKDRGRVIVGKPEVLILQEEIGVRLRFLKSQGIDGAKAVTKQPRIFGMTTDTMYQKIQALRSLRLDVPRVVRGAPMVLMMAADTIRARASFLISVGFKDPIELINKYPPALSLGVENLQNKIRFMTRLVYLYRTDQNASEAVCQSLALSIIESKPFMLGYGMAKLWTITRVMRALELTPEGEGLRVLHRLTEQNTEEVIIAFKRISHRFAKKRAPLTEVQRADLVKAFFVSLAEVRAQKLTAQQRVKILESYRNNNSDDSSEGDTLVYDTSSDPEVEEEYDDPKEVARLVETYFRNRRAA